MQTLINDIKALVRRYGVNYESAFTIDLANQELSDDSRTVADISLIKETDKLVITLYSDDKEYLDYPVTKLPVDDIESLLKLVEFAVVDIRENEIMEEDEKMFVDIQEKVLELGDIDMQGFDSTIGDDVFECISLELDEDDMPVLKVNSFTDPNQNVYLMNKKRRRVSQPSVSNNNLKLNTYFFSPVISTTSGFQTTMLSQSHEFISISPSPKWHSALPSAVSNIPSKSFESLSKSMIFKKENSLSKG